MYPRLAGKRQKKTIWLTEKTIETITGFAETHGLKLSEATEHLILLGLQDTHSIGLAEFVAAVVRREILHQYNRFAKLTAQAAIEAGAAKEAAQATYWWILLQENGAYVDSLEADEQPSLEELERLFAVDRKSADGQRVLAMFNKRKDRFRLRSVKALRTGLSELQSIMDELEAWEESQPPDPETAAY